MYIILHTMKHSTEHMADSTYEHGESPEPTRTRTTGPEPGTRTRIRTLNPNPNPNPSPSPSPNPHPSPHPHQARTLKSRSQSAPVVVPGHALRAERKPPAIGLAGAHGCGGQAASAAV